MKVIIFEGIDHTGKSTSIHALLSQLKGKVKVIHVDGKDKNDFSFYYDLLVKNKRNKIDYLIFDRFALGEFVYGNTYRFNNRLGFNDLCLLLNFPCEFEIFIKYIPLDKFDKYYNLLSKRDDIKINYPSDKVIKQCEQGHFMTLIDFIKFKNFNNVKVHESFFMFEEE